MCIISLLFHLTLFVHPNSAFISTFSLYFLTHLLSLLSLHFIIVLPLMLHFLIHLLSPLVTLLPHYTFSQPFFNLTPQPPNPTPQSLSISVFTFSLHFPKSFFASTSLPYSPSLPPLSQDIRSSLFFFSNFLSLVFSLLSLSIFSLQFISTPSRPTYFSFFLSLHPPPVSLPLFLSTI